MSSTVINAIFKGGVLPWEDKASKHQGTQSCYEKLNKSVTILKKKCHHMKREDLTSTTV